MSALVVEVLTYAPSEFYHCTHCEVVFRQAGMGRKVHLEQRESALPEELAQEYRALGQWAHSVAERFGDRVTVKVVDAASLEGFFKTLRYWTHRYPAYIVDGKGLARGADLEAVTAAIQAGLDRKGRERPSKF